MSDTQASLDAFDAPADTDTDTTDTSSTHDTDTTEDSLPSQEDLPPQTVWDRDGVVTLDGIRVMPPRNPNSFVALPGSASGVYKREVTVLLDDVSDYLDTFDCHSINTPKYYSDFEDMDTIVTKISAGENTGARGINGRHLENIVRYIAMKGGFAHTDLHVYAGADNHFLVTYQDDAYVVENTTVTPPSSFTYTPDTTTIKSFTIPEDDAGIQNGLHRFVDAIESLYDYSITDYIEHDADKHVFEIDSDRHISITGNNLHRLGTATTDISDICGDRTIQTAYDESFDISITRSDAEHDIGDRIRNGVVTGYNWSYEDPRTSSRASLSGSIKVYIEYRYMVERDNYDRFEVNTKRDRIATFDTENKDYNPLETP